MQTYILYMWINISASESEKYCYKYCFNLYFMKIFPSILHVTILNVSCHYNYIVLFGKLLLDEQSKPQLPLISIKGILSHWVEEEHTLYSAYIIAASTTETQVAFNQTWRLSVCAFYWAWQSQPTACHYHRLLCKMNTLQRYVCLLCLFMHVCIYVHVETLML